MLLWTFSQQYEKSNKISIDIYVFEIQVIAKFVSHEYSYVHYLWILSTLNFVDFVLISSIDSYSLFF